MPGLHIDNVVQSGFRLDEKPELENFVPLKLSHRYLCSCSEAETSFPVPDSIDCTFIHVLNFDHFVFQLINMRKSYTILLIDEKSQAIITKLKFCYKRSRRRAKSNFQRRGARQKNNKQCLTKI